jgi:hypothetical protein
MGIRRSTPAETNESGKEDGEEDQEVRNFTRKAMAWSRTPEEVRR